MTSSPLIVPESVRAYFADRTVEAGVDAILSISPNKLPPGISWAELPSYYRARAAAETVRCDLVELMHSAWNQVWGVEIAARWKREDIDDAVISIGECFNDQYFRVDYEVAGRQLFTSVGLRDRHLVCAFSLEKGSRVFVKGDLGGFEWVDDKAWGGWMVSIPSLPMSAELNLENLKGLAASAVKLVQQIA